MCKITIDYLPRLKLLDLSNNRLVAIDGLKDCLALNNLNLS